MRSTKVAIFIAVLLLIGGARTTAQEDKRTGPSDQSKVYAYFRCCLRTVLQASLDRRSPEDKKAFLDELGVPENVALELMVDQTWSRYQRALVVPEPEASKLLADLSYAPKATGQDLAKELATGKGFQRARENRTQINSALAEFQRRSLLIPDILQELFQRVQTLRSDQSDFQWWLEIGRRIFEAHLADAPK